MGKVKPHEKMFSKEEIAEAMRSIVISGKRIHVIAYGDGWGVLREGARRLYKIYRDKELAVAHAKRLAQRDVDGSVIVHKKDGSPERYVCAAE